MTIYKKISSIILYNSIEFELKIQSIQTLFKSNVKFDGNKYILTDGLSDLSKHFSKLVNSVLIIIYQSFGLHHCQIVVKNSYRFF